MEGTCRACAFGKGELVLMAGGGEGGNVEGLQYLDFIQEVIGSHGRCKSRRNCHVGSRLGEIEGYLGDRARDPDGVELRWWQWE